MAVDVRHIWVITVGKASMVLLVVLAMAMLLPLARPQPLEMRICAAHLTASSDVLSPVFLAIRLVYETAAWHFSTRDCSIVDNCQQLVGDDGLNVSIVHYPVMPTQLSNAQSSLACREDEGSLYLLTGPYSLPDTLVPINLASGIVTGTFFPGTPASQHPGMFSTRLSAEQQASGVMQFALSLGWNRLILLYQTGDEELADQLSQAAAAADVELGLFLVAHDFASKISSIMEFGSSIIVVSSYSSGSGSSAEFLQALQLCDQFGMLQAPYTWLGVVRANPQSAQLTASTISDESPFHKLVNGTLFLQPASQMDPQKGATLWESLFVPTVPGVPPLLVSPILDNFKNRMMREFSVIYDTIWLAAAAYARFKANGPCDTGSTATADSLIPWQTCLTEVSVAGASGGLALGPGYSKAGGLAANMELWHTFLPEGGQLLMQKHLATVIDNQLVMEEGMEGQLVWSDGTMFPNHVPTADIRVTERPNRSPLWVAVSIALLLMLAFVSVVFLYVRLRSTINSVASTTLDLQSPLAKAAELLQEVSSSLFLTQRIRSSALHIAMMLLHAEDVYAPDLANQADVANEDILSYLMFNNKRDKPDRQNVLYDGNSMSSGDSISDMHFTDEIFSDANVVRAADDSGVDLFFDSFALASFSPDKPLVVVGMATIKKFGLMKRFHLDERLLHDYISHIQEGYNDVPYHNRIHAADVLSRFCAILKADALFMDGSTNHNLLLLSGILAAIVHDYQHPGLGNSYQVAMDSPISREFNEQMVLENLSLNRALNDLRSPEFNFLHKMRNSQRRQLCSNVIALVLATDMSRHFELLSAFRTKVVGTLDAHLAKHPKAGRRRGSATEMGAMFHTLRAPNTSELVRLNQAAETSTHSIDIDGHTAAAWLHDLDEKQQLLTMQMALKIADVGHSSTSFDQHLQWSQRLQDEFFAQGDQEKQHALQVSPLMNRDKPGVMDASNQMYFADVIVIPMLEAWQELGPAGGGLLMQQTKFNRGEWEKKKIAMAAGSDTAA